MLYWFVLLLKSLGSNKYSPPVWFFDTVSDSLVSKTEKQLCCKLV